jgi:hypothetical protein
MSSASSAVSLSIRTPSNSTAYPVKMSITEQ